MLHNLFADLPAAVPGELIEVLLRAKNLRIERIVSQGNSSPPDFWYDQAEHEWVLLVQGAARLRTVNAAGITQSFELLPGDFLDLPAHLRHRVDWTKPEELTIWLAIFWDEAAAPDSAA
jgi:cupin 2 domain-containing protein